ncbi:MAG TPA: hypothetical protein VG753_00240 [Candidatus Paceibacterota bacterium]|nr:hypothetical protein [Candidatus Paceibacterota bacterium]
MSKETFVIVLGVWLVVATQIGVPFHPWLSIIYAISGLLVALMGFLLRTQALARDGKRSAHRPFVENSDTLAHSSLHDRKEGLGSLN